MVAFKYLQNRRWVWGLVLACVLGGAAVQAQQPRVWALYLKQTQDPDKKPLIAANKHFYVISTNATKLKKEDFFKSLITAIGPPPTLAGYQTELVKSGVAEPQAKEFISSWILGRKCETVYCQDITQEDIGKITVFKTAYDASKGVFGGAMVDGQERALRWLPNFLTTPVRTGYYELRRQWVECAVSYIEAAPDAAQNKGLGFKVVKGMTDKNGTTYFPSLPAGNYYVSNLVPFETGTLDKTVPNLWFTEQAIAATVKGSTLDVISRPAHRVEAKDLQSTTAPTFTCRK